MCLIYPKCLGVLDVMRPATRIASRNSRILVNRPSVLPFRRRVLIPNGGTSLINEEPIAANFRAGLTGSVAALQQINTSSARTTVYRSTRTNDLNLVLWFCVTLGGRRFLSKEQIRRRDNTVVRRHGTLTRRKRGNYIYQSSTTYD